MADVEWPPPPPREFPEAFEAALKRFKAGPVGGAGLRRHAAAVRAHNLLGVHAPADAGAGAGDGGVRFRLNEHPLGAEQAALHPGLGNLTDRFSDHQASPFAARRMARFTATRASWTL